MEKRVTLGVQRIRPIKRNNKKFLKKVVDYLKSDSYLFAPPVSSVYRSLKINHSSTAVEFKKPSNGNLNKRLLKKFVDYLKSDTYMYASLVDPPLLVRKSQKAGSSWKINEVSMKVSTIETTPKDNNRVTSEAADNNNRVTSKAADNQTSKDYSPENITSEKQSLVHEGTLKQTIYNNCRSSSIQVKQILGTQLRKLC